MYTQLKKRCQVKSINQWWCNPMVLQELWMVWEAISYLERVFHQVSKHLEVGQKNLAAPRFFNPLLRVWISWWNTLSRVWYITSNTPTTFEWKIMSKFCVFLTGGSGRPSGSSHKKCREHSDFISMHKLTRFVSYRTKLVFWIAW